MWRLCLCFVALTAAALAAPSYTFIAGALTPGQQPDGNSVILDAPGGLIVVDTGRHLAHQQKLLHAAKAHGKPVVAIINTHWHLDHTGGNAELRAAFPKAQIYASNAVDGALTGFLARSRAGAEDYLKSGKASPAQEAEIRVDFAAMDDVANLRPTKPITRSETVAIAGRRSTLNLAPFAATEGDVWIYDPKEKLAIVGDLVVGVAPFLDTACAEGWRAALGRIAAAPFETLIPGHGAPMTRADFQRWRTAFDNLLDCAGSTKAKDACVDGWITDAALFIGDREKTARGLVAYYLDTRLRAKPEKRDRYCRA